MFVMGIDPGLSRCGYGLVNKTSHKPQVVTAGVITTPIDWTLEKRLELLDSELRSLFEEFNPNVAVVERVFFQTNARTAMSVGQASGLALVNAVRTGCSVMQYTANEVKLAITGDGAADKMQVQKMVQRLLSLPSIPKPPDVADALALALCHSGQANFRKLTEVGS